MKRWLRLAGLVLVVILFGVSAFFVYNPDADHRWSSTNWIDRFATHDSFVKFATMIRDSTCTRLLLPPAQGERRIVFTWDAGKPWVPESDTVNHLPVRRLAPQVNRVLAGFAQTAVTDTFVTVSFEGDSIVYFLYARQDNAQPETAIASSLMAPLDLYFQHGQAHFAVTENTGIGQAWLGWCGSGQATDRTLKPYRHGGMSGHDPAFRATEPLDTVRIDYGDAMTYEIVGKESPVAPLWRTISGKR